MAHEIPSTPVTSENCHVYRNGHNTPFLQTLCKCLWKTCYSKEIHKQSLEYFPFVLCVKCILSLFWGSVPWQYPQQASFRAAQQIREPESRRSSWLCSQIRGLVLFVLSALSGDFSKEVSSFDLSVLINPEDPHTVQLGQLGDEHSEQGNGVDHKMDPIVFGVEAG